MNRIVLTLILAIGIACGCKKKPLETVPDTAPPPPVSPSPKPSPAPVAAAATGSTTPAGGSGVAASRLGGGSAYGAARRTQALNEMKNLGLLILNLRDEIGKMPTKDQILAEVKKTAPNILKGIDEGAYILTGTSDGSGLWAYEIDADKLPGIALIGGTAQRSTPDEVKRWLSMMN